MSDFDYITARQILDSRGTPTIEVDVVLSDGSLGRAAVPSGHQPERTRRSSFATAKRSIFSGNLSPKRSKNVNEKIAPAILANKLDPFDQVALDNFLIRLDGTENKGNLGANAILGVSLATPRAAAQSMGRYLYEFIGGVTANFCRCR